MIDYDMYLEIKGLSKSSLLGPPCCWTWGGVLVNSSPTLVKDKVRLKFIKRDISHS